MGATNVSRTSDEPTLSMPAVAQSFPRYSGKHLEHNQYAEQYSRWYFSIDPMRILVTTLQILELMPCEGHQTTRSVLSL